jgi:Methylmalonyl-CoA mutase
MWEEFPPISTAEWEATIRADLKGADYAKKLVWQTEEGFAVKPYTGAKTCPAQPARRDSTASGSQGVRRIFPRTQFEAICCTNREQRPCKKLAMHWPNRPASAITFVFAVGGNYFMEIAKLRAARQLWARISKEPVVIWSRTSSFPHRAASMGASLP